MSSFRPSAPEGKISTGEDWELCYLRHAYLRKVGFNPTPEQMAPYSKVNYFVSKNTFYRYEPLFCSVGLGLEDIANISLIHLVSFLGLFSMEVLPEKYEDFANNFQMTKGRIHDANDLLNKNKANYTLFLKQRMEDLVRTSVQKVKNIKGFPQKQYIGFRGDKNVPTVDVDTFLADYSKYGFKKIDWNAFRSAKNKVSPKDPQNFILKGKHYFAVKIGARNLNFEDLTGAGLDPHDNDSHMMPDNILLKKESESFWGNKLVEFENYDKNRKKKILSRFIRLNAGKTDFKVELQTARKLLKELRNRHAEGSSLES